ncbi:VIT1/CCC1 transporter family protein [Candidatus Uhrbacteria bacterium]|nr:VIT1/CCC1 transporter family protein [Candidatus Uhrbacteria bacterium]
MNNPAYLHNQRNGLASSIRELVFGVEDSLVSTLGVVVGVAAGTEDSRVVLLSGAVLVVVEALSMGAGSYLSSKSHRQLLETMIAEEKEEIELHPEEEAKELADMYRARGFSEEEIAMLIKRVTGDKKLWLEEMIAKELRIGAGELETPPKNAAVMLVSYLIAGLIPVAPYMLLPVATASLVAFGVTAAALFGLGFWKGRLTKNNGVRSGIEMLLVSSAAALIGYGVGRIAGSFFGLDLPR